MEKMDCNILGNGKFSIEGGSGGTTVFELVKSLDTDLCVSLKNCRCKGLNTEKSSSALRFRAKSVASGDILSSNSFRMVEMRWDFRKCCEHS